MNPSKAFFAPKNTQICPHDALNWPEVLKTHCDEKRPNLGNSWNTGCAQIHVIERPAYSDLILPCNPNVIFIASNCLYFSDYFLVIQM
jgi:hypothetical protein